MTLRLISEAVAAAAKRKGISVKKYLSRTAVQIVALAIVVPVVAFYKQKSMWGEQNYFSAKEYLAFGVTLLIVLPLVGLTYDLLRYVFGKRTAKTFHYGLASLYVLLEVGVAGVLLYFIWR